jgi:hypothetical protein
LPPFSFGCASAEETKDEDQPDSVAPRRGGRWPGRSGAKADTARTQAGSQDGALADSAPAGALSPDQQRSTEGAGDSRVAGSSYEIDVRLNPGADPLDYLSVVQWPEIGGTTVVVAHQPAIGRLAARLLAGIEADWGVRKGAIWWLQYRQRDGKPQTLLRTMMTPDQL